VRVAASVDATQGLCTTWCRDGRVFEVSIAGHPPWAFDPDVLASVVYAFEVADLLPVQGAGDILRVSVGSNTMMVRVAQRA